MKFEIYIPMFLIVPLGFYMSWTLLKLGSKVIKLIQQKLEEAEG